MTAASWRRTSRPHWSVVLPVFFASAGTTVLAAHIVPAAPRQAGLPRAWFTGRAGAGRPDDNAHGEPRVPGAVVTTESAPYRQWLHAGNDLSLCHAEEIAAAPGHRRERRIAAGRAFFADDAIRLLEALGIRAHELAEGTAR